jgi:predicted nuclease of predicted toxin-antitoxin system
MPRFLVDEDLPRSLARILQEAGFEAQDVRDVGLRGRNDDAVLDHARKNKQVLLTGDLGFGNLLRFPLGSHEGIFIVHYPNQVSNALITDTIIANLRALAEDEIRGGLAILEPGKLRLRRRP